MSTLIQVHQPAHFKATKAMVGRSYTCGCPLTNHPLPRLVHLSKNSYSQTKLDDSWELHPDSECASCLLATQHGIEQAITALWFGDAPLVEHDTVQSTFLLLIDRRWHSQAVGGDADLDWGHIWCEWAKMLQEQRARVHVPELMRTLRDLPVDHGAEWWVEMLQLIGIEAFLCHEVLVKGKSVPDPGPGRMRALEREARTIQSVGELEAFLQVTGELYDASLAGSAEGIRGRLMSVYPAYLRR
ncbi:hypothetical protein F5Y15DRAFT_370001 [Xylariaceae sp. FL0016]|nr:hypothetical protein F5Y15DRAFT_370001 [Xylariaceae sp. FL0016]